MDSGEIRQLRKALSVTTRELAAALGIEQKEVLAWERGDAFPTKRHVLAMKDLAAKGASAAARARQGEPGAGAPFEALRDPSFWEIVRKLAAHPALRAAVEKLAEGYADPD